MYFKAVSVEERLPEVGKWVTTIDTAGEHRVYRLMEHGWDMRDADAINSPNNNLHITHWLEEVTEYNVALLEEAKESKTVILNIDKLIDKLIVFTPTGNVSDKSLEEQLTKVITNAVNKAESSL